MPSVPVATVIGEVLAELNVVQAGARLSSNLTTLVLSKINQIRDNWNAERAKVWCEIFTSFTLTPSLSPHTIGPSGATFTMAIRPVTLDGCDLALTTTSPLNYQPIDIIDDQAYEALSTPGITTSMPTCVYYEEDWPNGKLFFYPVPNYAYGVRLKTRTLLGVVALTDSLDMPPGYQEAITLTAAEACATPLGRGVPAQTTILARRARARIDMNNVVIPVLDLQDGQQDDATSGLMNYHDRSFL